MKVLITSIVLLAVVSLEFNAAAQRRPNRPSPRTPEQQPNSSRQNDVENAQWRSPDCKSIRSFFEKGYPSDVGKGQLSEAYSSYTRQKALAARQRLVESPEWDTLLPCCPESVRLAAQSPLFTTDNWLMQSFDAKVLLKCFHPGAESDFRTSELYHRVTGQSAGQQCTYDKNGTLISPDLPGAGTPDFVSPTLNDGSLSNGFFSQHLFFDVFPWTMLSRTEYDSVWKPDPGCNKGRPFDLDPTMINVMFFYVKRGDVISVSATGKIKFDVEGNESGPEGSLVIPKTETGIIGRLIAPNPLPTARPGALLGGVYTGELRSLHEFIIIDEEDLFYVGKGGDFRMPDTGYLAFTVNDGYLPNNSGSFSINFYRKVAR